MLLTPKQKKDFITKLIKEGKDKRSYNEIAADLELEIWTYKMKGEQENELQRSKGRLSFQDFRAGL